MPKWSATNDIHSDSANLAALAADHAAHAGDLAGQEAICATYVKNGVVGSGFSETCLLVMSGLEPTTAFDCIGKARGVEVPETAEQRDWVFQFARELTTSVTRL